MVGCVEVQPLQHLTSACWALAVKLTITEHLAIKLSHYTNKPREALLWAYSEGHLLWIIQAQHFLWKTSQFDLWYFWLSHLLQILADLTAVPLWWAHSPSQGMLLSMATALRPQGSMWPMKRGDSAFNPRVQQASAQTLRMRARRWVSGYTDTGSALQHVPLLHTASSCNM